MNTKLANSVQSTISISASRSSRGRAWFPYVTAVVVAILRALTSGPPYFADGPLHLGQIAHHVYAIQPPGYWLFTRLASLFPNPEEGIHYMNWTFSALGVFVFYFVAKRMVTPLMAELGTLLYASIYIAWFAGNIHSTYASELFFPVLLVLFILRYREQHRLGDLVGTCAAFALSAGFRPSDGIFLTPLFLFFIVRYVLPWRQKCAAVVLACLLCLAWFIPNEAALREATKQGHWSETNTNWRQLESVAPFAKGFGKLAITNAIRVVFPLTLAVWPLVPWLFRRESDREFRTLLWLWILPGLGFFLLIYMSDATYLCYLLAAVVISFCLGSVTRQKVVAAALCIAFNISFYMVARPVVVTSAPTAIFDTYGAKYTLWGVRHQYFKTLREIYPDSSSKASGMR